ncbi:MAG: hypothetical protein J3Q66DRAFT_331748 [Benniella sp.]|nr:MAG: hypothetical protein J3Q66DRAFT_331748 [Benniella sp.]
MPKAKASRNARNNNNNNNDDKDTNSSGNTPATSADATDSKVDLRKWVVPEELGISPYFSKFMYQNWHHWGFVQHQNSTLATMEDDYKEFRRGLEVLITADIVPPKIKKRARRVIERNDHSKFTQYAQERAERKAKEHAMNAKRATEFITTGAKTNKIHHFAGTIIAIADNLFNAPSPNLIHSSASSELHQTVKRPECSCEDQL